MTENITPEFRKNMRILGFILLALADFFVFASLLFQDFMVELMLMLAPDYSVSQFSTQAQATLLFFSAILGAVMYLPSTMLFAIGETDSIRRRNWLLLGLGSWYLMDSIASFVFGFGFNVITNTLLLIAGLYFILKK